MFVDQRGNIELKELIQVSKEVLELAAQIDVSRAVSPLNREEEKKRCLSSDGILQSEPHFTYLPPGPELTDLRERVDALGEIPGSSIVSEWLRGKVEELSLQLEIVLQPGNRERVVAASKGLYGVPDHSLCQRAREVLATLPKPVDRQNELGQADLAAAFQEELSRKGITNFSVVLGETAHTYVSPAGRFISVGKRGLSESDIAKLIEHEIRVHVFRAVNGYSQPEPYRTLFATGLPGYEATEEGLAAYAEEKSGTSTGTALFRYAFRVLAVESLLHGASFGDTFSVLRKVGATPSQAWLSSLRAHRGGGYLKDHIYLQGYELVRRFAEVKGDLALLYCGKVGLRDLETVELLLRSEELKSPLLIPDYFRVQSSG